MDKVLTTVLLIVAGVVSAVMVMNMIIPAVQRSSSDVIAVSNKLGDRINSDITILEADVDGNNVIFWVKNVGTFRVVSIENSDIFYGQEGDFVRIPYGAGDPYWDFSFEGGATEWTTSKTLKVTIHLSSPPSGTKWLKMVIPTGIMDEHTFSV